MRMVSARAPAAASMAMKTTAPTAITRRMTVPPLAAALASPCRHHSEIRRRRQRHATSGRPPKPRPIRGLGNSLGTPENPHPLQKAYIAEEVPQCGYCLNGWLLTAAAFLRQNPKPSDGEIREALSGLKCRCGTHMAILRAVKRAAASA